MEEDSFTNIPQEQTAPEAGKSKTERILFIAIAFILLAILSMVLAYFFLYKPAQIAGNNTQASSEEGIFSGLKSSSPVSLKDIYSLEEEADDAERIPDYEMLIDIYTELLSKIEKLEVSEAESYQLKGLSLEEYKTLKKESYEKKLEFYKSVPTLIEQQISSLRANISLTGNDVEKAYYTEAIARLYINKKDYALAEATLDEAYLFVKDLNETDFFQKFYPEKVYEDGTVIPARSSTFSVQDVKKKIFSTYWDLWEITGIKEEKSQEIKSRLDSNPEDYDSFMFLEKYHQGRNIDYSEMLEYYLYVDSLADTVSYQYYLNSMISSSYKELGDYQGQQEFLKKTSSGDIISDMQIANTYASQGDLIGAVNYMENLYPGFDNNTCWYKANFYSSLAFKSSNGYNPMNNTYFEISNAHYEFCNAHAPINGRNDAYNYYIAENYFWMGDKAKCKEILQGIIENSDSEQEIAMAQEFIENRQL